MEQSRAPLMAHIAEARQRLMYMVGVLLIAFIGAYVVSEDIFNFLVEPLEQAMADQGYDPKVVYTSLLEAFFTKLKIAFYTAFFVTFPFIAIQFWLFVAPGLYKNEKQALAPFLVATPVLFFLGGALVYYFVFPLAWQFFISFETPGGNGTLPIQLEARVGEYLSLVMKLIFAFGLCFQLPIALTLMGRVGIVSSQGLREKRKYAIIITFIVAAILTPPDIISQVGLAVPILVLYEISILAVRMVEGKRLAAEADEGEE
jgi:sec-independent protein translocase protein TatC